MANQATLQGMGKREAKKLAMIVVGLPLWEILPILVLGVEFICQTSPYTGLPNQLVVLFTACEDFEG
eukprot:7588824-Ditylum_brightwellii.AAC.1